MTWFVCPGERQGRPRCSLSHWAVPEWAEARAWRRCGGCESRETHNCQPCGSPAVIHDGGSIPGNPDLVPPGASTWRTPAVDERELCVCVYVCVCASMFCSGKLNMLPKLSGTEGE